MGTYAAWAWASWRLGLLLLLVHMRGVGVGFEAAGGPMLLLELLFEYEVHV